MGDNKSKNAATGGTNKNRSQYGSSEMTWSNAVDTWDDLDTTTWDDYTGTPGGTNAGVNKTRN